MSIDLEPSALGPNSDRFWNHPTILLSARCFATTSHSSSKSSYFLYFVSTSASSTSALSYVLPRRDMLCGHLTTSLLLNNPRAAAPNDNPVSSGNGGI